MSDGPLIIGDYKIEPGTLADYCYVRKALGPLIRNWSWVIFYAGTTEQCTRYIEWASRVDAGDRGLFDHAASWWASVIGVPELSDGQRHWLEKHVQHAPKQLHYDFEGALEAHPYVEAPDSSSGAFLVIFVVVIALVICGFIYHSM